MDNWDDMTIALEENDEFWNEDYGLPTYGKKGRKAGSGSDNDGEVKSAGEGEGAAEGGEDGATKAPVELTERQKIDMMQEQ